VGVDTASIDFGQSTHFESHQTLFKHGVPALENVKLIAELPEVDFHLIALPMNIAGGSGGPTRIVALLPRD
jgi:kynurenine formamidase